MQVIADLQLHSKYSRAVSPQMTIPFIGEWAAKKGIGLVATGDWTHPLWIREIEANLEEDGNGLLRLKSQIPNSKFQTNSKSEIQNSKFNTPLFMLATEVSSIYSQGGKGRRVHTLIWVPTLAAAEKINEALRRWGCNLMSDGRPIIGLSCIEVADLVLNIEPKALIIPAHAWTPWFSVFGGMSGFDSLEEAFGKFAKNVYAVETGLSSNPGMNWRIKELDNRAILSFSDAHSGPKLGREATVFKIKNSEQPQKESSFGSWSTSTQPKSDPSGFGRTSEFLQSKNSGPSEKSKIQIKNQIFSYDDIYGAIAQQSVGKNDGNLEIGYTIEFYPEEGKYHYSGHRNCGVSFGPDETVNNKGICPVCNRSLTQGVMQRVEELAGRSETDLKISEIRDQRSEIRMIKSGAFPKRPPFAMLVPLLEIISEAIGSPPSSPKTMVVYENLVNAFGGEFAVLLTTSIDEIGRIGGERAAEGISKVRRGDIEINPGYDGVFGKVKIWKEAGEKEDKEQLSLFE